MKFKGLLSKPKEQNTKKSFQEWTKIKDVSNNKLVMLDKNLIFLKIQPVNFKLKSSLEQKSILNAYKLFLKNLNSKTQIIISSKKTNVNDHIDEILKVTKDNPQIQEMSEDYIFLIKQLVSEKGSVTKEFYLILEENPNIINDENKIVEYLNGCGNEVVRATNDEIISLVKNYTNKRLQLLI